MSFRNDIYDIQAFVDDELTSDEAQRISKKISQNPDLKKYYEDICLQKLYLRKWWESLH